MSRLIKNKRIEIFISMVIIFTISIIFYTDSVFIALFNAFVYFVAFDIYTDHKKTMQQNYVLKELIYGLYRHNKAFDGNFKFLREVYENIDGYWNLDDIKKNTEVKK